MLQARLVGTLSLSASPVQKKITTNRRKKKDEQEYDETRPGHRTSKQYTQIVNYLVVRDGIKNKPGRAACT